MPIFTRNFRCDEVQVLAATGTTSNKTFTTRAGMQARDVRFVNNGTVPAWVVFGATAVVTGSANGTQQYLLLPGEDVVLRKPGTSQLPTIATITDTGTTSIVAHAGEGS